MNEIESRLPGVERIPVRNLLLDGDNPRLPESLHRGSQSELLDFLRKRSVLEELAQSYLDNGFFQSSGWMITDRSRSPSLGPRACLGPRTRSPSPTSTCRA